MIEELNLNPTEAVAFLIVCLVLFALLTWYTERQEWLELPLDQEPVETTTDSVQARYGAYIQLHGKRYN